jgi:hypothetical protein
MFSTFALPIHPTARSCQWRGSCDCHAKFGFLFQLRHTTRIREQNKHSKVTREHKTVRNGSMNYYVGASVCLCSAECEPIVGEKPKPKPKPKFLASE